MKSKLWLAGLVVGCLGAATAQAGLFDHGHGGYGPGCCVPQATCAAPAPACCVPQPVQAAPAPVCYPQQPSCAAPVVNQCCPPAPACCERERECFLVRCFRGLCDLERRKNRCLMRTFLGHGRDDCGCGSGCDCQSHGHGYCPSGCDDPMLPYYPPAAYRGGYGYGGN